MSLPIDEILAVLRDHIPSDSPTLTAIAKDLIAAEKEVKAAAAAEKDAPKSKSRMVVLIRGDASLKRLVEGGAWVVTIPDDPTQANATSSTLLQRITKAVKTHNENLRGKNRAAKVIRTFARAMDWLRPKSIDMAQSAFRVKTKVAVEVVVVESEEVGK